MEIMGEDNYISKGKSYTEEQLEYYERKLEK